MYMNVKAQIKCVNVTHNKITNYYQFGNNNVDA